MKSVNIRNISLGQGIPKICVPLVGQDCESLRREAACLHSQPVDIAEWRADRYAGILEPGALSPVLLLLRQVLGDIPLLFTFRTAGEGGSCPASLSSYAALVREAILSGSADAVDVELFSGEETVKELIALARSRQVKVILSNHDFHSTPSREELVRRLGSMDALGADIAKIAVMPEHAADVLTLLSATVEACQVLSCPVITMSMKGTGLVSRLSGEIFGSCLTFGTVGEASAPGQICAGELKEVLEILHRNFTVST